MSVEDSLAKAKAVGIVGIVQVGVDVPSSRWALKTAKEFSQIHATVAIHPNDAPVIALEKSESALDEAIAEISELAQDEAVRAIGETGVDFFRTSVEGRDFQEKSFRAHIQIANKLNKPVMVHDRDAHQEALRILDEEKAQQVIFHCFSGTLKQAKEIIDLGFLLGIGGVATYKNGGLDKILPELGIDHIVLETDGPYLAPVPHRGKRNSPEYIPLIAEKVAEFTQSSLEKVSEVTIENSNRIFHQFKP
jgi:TatD DNase family protein